MERNTDTDTEDYQGAWTAAAFWSQIRKENEHKLVVLHEGSVNDVTDINVGDKPSCKICEKITDANKDIFWVFARTHQPGTREEVLQIPDEDVQVCPVCGREITKDGADGGQ